MIRLGEVIKESIVDGPGIRVVVFLQGCLRDCQGCHNPGLQDIEGGQAMGEKELAELILGQITPIHRGVTFSGGEPLLQAESLVTVIEQIRQKKPDIDVWMYTGYLFEEVAEYPIMSLIDVLVDGPFIKAQRDPYALYFGSSNQRIIDVRASLKLKKPVEQQLLDAAL